MSDGSAAVLKRKELQLRYCLSGNAESALKTGFERYYLINQSLPEMTPEEIDTSCLGASFVGMALPLLSPAVESHEAVREKIRTTIDEFKAAMFCCAQKNVPDLRQSRCIQEIKK